MTELFLIAHKVRGEPAFDVAIQMQCPLCTQDLEGEPTFHCPECEATGYWWIIPTSGHRAYPFAHWYVSELRHGDEECSVPINAVMPLMPNNWPDHYTTRGEPRQTIDVAALIPHSPPQRRF